MDKQLRHLIHQLKGRSYPDAVTEQLRSFMPEAIEVMAESISKDEFTSIQTRNSLNVMFELTKVGHWNYRECLFRLLTKCVLSKDVNIRSEAAFILIRFVMLKRLDIIELSYVDEEYVKSAVRNAFEQGVSVHLQQYIKKFIGGD